MAFTTFSARPSKAQQQAEKERAAREKASRKAERARRSRERRRQEEAESARRWWEQQRQRSNGGGYAPSRSSSISAADREVALEILGAGLRVMARRHHPDLGGDHETMVAINRVADKLRDIINGK